MKNPTNLQHVITVIFTLVFLTILIAPFSFLSFWWACLWAYGVIIAVLALFIYGSIKQNREYDAMLERELAKIKEQEKQNL